MALVAIGWQVYDVRENPLDLALIGLAEFLPLLLLALPAGQLADRLPRRRLLALMASLDIVFLGGLLAVTIAGADRVWPFFVLAFLFGVSSALGAPAGRALIPSLVPQEILVSALAQRSVVLQISVVIAPAVGGLLFALSAELVYAVAIGLAVISLGCFLALHGGRQPAAEGISGLGEVLAGVRLIRRTNVLLGAISLDLFAVFSAVPLHCSRSSRRTSSRWGRPVSASSARRPRSERSSRRSMLARYPVRRRAGPTLFVVVVGFGVCMVAFGLSQTMWLSLLALALGGAFDMVSVVLRSTILPLVTPDELRGRVNAVEMVFISGSNELGAFESGVAAALIGAVPAVVLGGVATIVVAGAWWKLFPSLAKVDRLDELRPVASDSG